MTMNWYDRVLFSMRVASDRKSVGISILALFPATIAGILALETFGLLIAVTVAFAIDVSAPYFYKWVSHE